MTDRQTMIAELKRVVQPHLRAEKFVGAFPHFRRLGQGAIDLVTFQFDRHGGGFLIEIARCPVDGLLSASGVPVPPNRTSAWDVHPNYRKRIQQRPGSGTECWFRFDTVAAPQIAAEVLSRLSQPGVWGDVRIGASKLPRQA
jgi:hypothetical protein